MALVKIDPEFEAYIAPLTEAEFAQLEENIRREGCRDPLRQWGDLLLDGHNRYHICKKWDIPFGTTPIELPDREAALLWIDENQLGRRNLNDSQRGLIAGRVANCRAEISRRERAAEAGKSGGNGRSKKKSSLGNTALPELNDEQPTPRIANEVAAKSNIPLRKVRAGQKLDKAAQKSEEGKQLVKKVQDGEMTLAQAMREVRAESPAEPHPPRKTTQLAFHRCETRVVTAIWGANDALDNLDLDLDPVTIHLLVEGLEEMLKTALAFEKKISVLITKLRTENVPATVN